MWSKEIRLSKAIQGKGLPNLLRDQQHDETEEEGVNDYAVTDGGSAHPVFGCLPISLALVFGIVLCLIIPFLGSMPSSELPYGFWNLKVIHHNFIYIQGSALYVSLN